MTGRVQKLESTYLVTMSLVNPADGSNVETFTRDIRADGADSSRVSCDARPSACEPLFLVR